MFSASTKRLKLTKEKNEYSSVDAESGFHSEIDFSSSATTTSKSTSIDNVFHKSPEKRMVLAPRRASLNQNSLSSSDVHHFQQHQTSSSTSGYSSLLSSFSSNLTGSTSVSSRQSRTPKKRKLEISESDENVYNAKEFISPSKIRKKDDKKSAKLVLKEKSCSENVILSSTPIRSTNNEKWQKFHSFHPERIKDFGKSFDDDDETNNKIANFETSQKLSDDNSLDISSFNLSNASFNLTSSLQQQQHDIPANFHNLWTDEIKPQETKHSIVQSIKPCESQGSLQSSFSQSTVSSTTTSERKKKFFNGRTTFDILGRLYANHDIAVENILNHLNDESLLSLSHVSKQYRKMIQSNKSIEIRRQNYLKATKSIKENKLPGSSSEKLSATRTTYDKKKRKAFTDFNKNENQMTLRRKQSPAPHSPSTQMHKKFQSQQNKVCKKCPRCCRPATIKKVKIRNSPRKKKNNILSISTSISTTGRVQKRTKTFLSKTTIDTFHDSSLRSSPLFVSLADDELSRSPNRSSSCESPNSSLSGDDINNFDEIYEYGVCESNGCSYKFCVKCNCKYHPRRQCADLSPPSPNRYFKFNESGGACTRASNKSLRRLAY
ncbi:hypothetical protein PVAND_010237 [Polypedilum vanderplanki]|uniref:F-box domain-containing protein n=1 Tax=Polypedilum vanderplanki TaxID=319348 RepID=A0A9J6CF94_POLVA|nr:hypothetical protein PVAND_010237 [Polypedilum vanderplanki]